MANTIRIKRRAAGGAAGAPGSLFNAELAFNEQDNTLYYGFGIGSGTTAAQVVPIAGKGAFADLTTNQTIGGTKTFSNTITGSISGNAGTATKWASGITLSLTGDVTYTSTSIDGSANVTAAATLATVNSSPQTDLLRKITVNGKGLVTATSAAVLNDIGAPTSSFAFNSQKITGLADPSDPQDAATKNYVDSVAQGLDPKQSVKAATTTNITLSGLQNIDGISVQAGDRVLVRSQNTASQNGIYVAGASAWARAADMSIWAEVPNAFVFVEEGNTLADTGWVVTSNQGGTIDATAITWVQFSGAGSYTAGNGLQLVGNEFSVKADGTTITVAAAGIKVSDTYAGNTSISSVGTITAGTWNAGVIGATYGGTGVNNGSNTITLGGNISTANSFTTSGNNALTLTTTGTTNVTLPTTGTLVNTAVTALTSLAQVGTITSGTWNGSIIGAAYGGTGVDNTGKTITLGGNVVTGGAFSTSGAHALTLTLTGATDVTLPTTGTLVNTAVATLSSLSSIGTITTGVWNGSTVAVAYGGTGATSFTSKGIVYGNASSTTGALASTAMGGEGQFLSANASGVPVWTDLVDGGTF